MKRPFVTAEQLRSITQVINEFYDTSFSNSATNYAMYDLIHGGDTVVYTKEGEFAYNDTVLASHEETDNEDGSKTYTMTINDGLVWSDGSPITAKDYVFALLCESSDEMGGVDGYPGNAYTVLVGYDEFHDGTADTFAGVRLIDDMTFSVTIKAEELPYHYDISYAGVRPRPMAVIAPGCDVEDTENGAQITGDFTTELLQETINNIDTGYRYNPQVTCGPYLFAGFDEAAQEATLTVNPNYMGDYRGVKPVIETLVVRTVSSDTMMNELQAGSVDLLYESSGADTINAGLDLVEEGVAADTTYYPGPQRVRPSVLRRLRCRCGRCLRPGPDRVHRECRLAGREPEPLRDEHRDRQAAAGRGRLEPERRRHRVFRHRHPLQGSGRRAGPAADHLGQHRRQPGL